MRMSRHPDKHSLIQELVAKGTVQSEILGKGPQRPELHRVLLYNDASGFMGNKPRIKWIEIT